MNNSEPKNLFEAISRISYFSYEPAIGKFPYLKEYLKGQKDPKSEWTLMMTAAGTGYALLKEESYVGEHDELIQSISAVTGLPNIIEKYENFIRDVYKDTPDLYPHAMAFWIITQIKNGKPTIEELDGLGKNISNILYSTIHDYEATKAKK